MGATNLPEDWGTWKRDIERQLREIRDRVGNVSGFIGQGGLQIGDGGSLKMTDAAGPPPNVLFYIGPDPNNPARQLLEIRRENGVLIMRTFYLPGGQVVWALHDRTGRLIFSDDGISGQGVAEPWIPVPMYPRAFPNAFLDSTDTDLTLPASACSGGTVWEGRIGKPSHPKLHLDMVCGRVTGVSGTPTYSLVVSGTTLDTWSATTYAPLTRGPLDITPYMGQIGTIIQVKISAAGTGTDRVALGMLGVWQRQS